jgi:hypothetical protein
MKWATVLLLAISAAIDAQACIATDWVTCGRKIGRIK